MVNNVESTFSPGLTSNDTLCKTFGRSGLERSEELIDSSVASHGVTNREMFGSNGAVLGPCHFWPRLDELRRFLSQLRVLLDALHSDLDYFGQSTEYGS